MAETPVKIWVVIPSRYGAVRLPGKPLVQIAGKPMIQRVWERGAGPGEIDFAGGGSYRRCAHSRCGQPDSAAKRS